MFSLHLTGNKTVNDGAMNLSEPSHAMALPIILHPGDFPSLSSCSPCVALTVSPSGHRKCQSKKRFYNECSKWSLLLLGSARR